jgi:valine--pyruvate aminotransferase
MTFSLFGDKFTRHAGITRLMEDLNDGLRTPGAIMPAAVTRRKFRR